jgi:hypothetical protein
VAFVFVHRFLSAVARLVQLGYKGHSYYFGGNFA